MRIKAMGLSNVKSIQTSAPRSCVASDVKRIALKIDETKKLGFRRA
jgi:hypothetical protein